MACGRGHRPSHRTRGHDPARGTSESLRDALEEDGAWSLDVSEREPGSFAGALEFPGSAKPLYALCNVTEIDGHLHIRVSVRSEGAPWVWTIYAE